MKLSIFCSILLSRDKSAKWRAGNPGPETEREIKSNGKNRVRGAVLH
ncbi:hypothetical protein Q3A80_29915 [Burkholderia sp. SR8]